MKKIILLVICVLSVGYISAQSLTEYTASNNVTYHIGDTIKLGRGSAPNGEFIYCQMGDAYSAMAIIGGRGQINQGLPKNLSGVNMIIKKIKEITFKGAKLISFNVAGGNFVQYKILVEDALATGELKSNGYTSDEALSALKKAKDKLDLGLIKPEQYDSIKSTLVKFIK
ncbi:MAG: hypothetical protein WCK78_14295 [Paludibacter sp.]|jgi:hypothetical protein